MCMRLMYSTWYLDRQASCRSSKALEVYERTAERNALEGTSGL